METSSLHVAAIWRYPVKAMLGESLAVVQVGVRGLSGDRAWTVIDAESGERIANKRGPTHPALRACRAELLDASCGRLPLRVTLPAGEAVEGDDVEVAVSDLIGRRIRLSRHASGPVGRLFATGAYHDCAPLHLVTSRSLAHLRALQPASDFDVRRLRPNLLIDDGDAPGAFTDDALLGGTVRASGGLSFDVCLPTPRCVVLTRAQEELPLDPGLLRTVVQHHRFDFGQLGRHGCVGAYAVVTRPGALGLGDRLTARTYSRMSTEDVVSDLVERLIEQLEPTVPGRTRVRGGRDRPGAKPPLR